MNPDEWKVGFDHFNNSVSPINLNPKYLDGWFYALGMRLAELEKPLYTGDAIVQGYGYGKYLEGLKSKKCH
jgi:hypothetical protein